MRVQLTSRLFVASLATTLIIAAAGGLIAVAAGPLSGTAPRSQPTASPRVSTCGGAISTTLSAETVRICDAVTVTTAVEPLCPGACGDGLNVLFVLPSDPCCAGAPWTVAEASAAVRSIADDRRASSQPVKAGVLLYSDRSPREAIELTDISNTNDIIAAIRGVRMGIQYAGAFSAAARYGLAMLEQGHTDDQGRPLQPCEIVVFFGHNVGELGTPEFEQKNAEIIQAGTRLASTGAELVVACSQAGQACDAMKQLARGRAAKGRYTDYTGPPLTHLVDRAWGEFRGGTSVSVAGSGFRQLLPSGLGYVDGSASVPPAAVAKVGAETRLGWGWNAPLATQPQTVTYAVEPLAEGKWPIDGSLVVTDTAKASAVVPMQPVTVTVSGLCLPSPSPTPPPTASPVTPTPTSTNTPEPTATATVPREPKPVYLPLVLKEDCQTVRQRADIALVIDTSGSMAGAKLTAAKDAAVTFVGLMDLTPHRDQVTIVRFDTDAEVVQQLTSDRASAESAIRSLDTRSGTYMDRGLGAALAELQSPRHAPGNLPVAVLLTDGQQTGGPDAAVAAGQAVRDAGVRLYIIGLGADVDEPTLRAVAGVAGRYHFAPDETHLKEIYAEVARDIQCPGERFWPYRP